MWNRNKTCVNYGVSIKSRLKNFFRVVTKEIFVCTWKQFLALSSFVLLFSKIMICVLLPLMDSLCLVLSCLALRYLTSPRLALPCLVLSCLKSIWAIWQTRGLHWSELTGQTFRRNACLLKPLNENTVVAGDQTRCNKLKKTMNSNVFEVILHVRSSNASTAVELFEKKFENILIAGNGNTVQNPALCTM